MNERVTKAEILKQLHNDVISYATSGDEAMTRRRHAAINLVWSIPGIDGVPVALWDEVVYLGRNCRVVGIRMDGWLMLKVDGCEGIQMVEIADCSWPKPSPTPAPAVTPQVERLESLRKPIAKAFGAVTPEHTMSNGMDWIPFQNVERHGWTKQKLPPERRRVLCKIKNDINSEGGVVVGYLRYAAGDEFCPYFVCSAIPHPWEVTHWCDCLGDDFHAPGGKI